jgi:hypothetical protein
MFNGVWPNILATVTCLRWTMSYKDEYWWDKGLFFNSKTSIPSPPWSFGRQMKFHFVNLFLFSALCQNNLDL